MGCGKYDVTSTCGERVYSECVFYQRELPEWSSLEEGCVTTASTTQELYDEVSDIKESLDTKDLGKSCIEYDTDNFGQISQKEVNKTFETEICNVKDLLQEASNAGAVFCQNLDYGNLVDPNDCDGKPTTWCEFAQFILNKLK